MSRSDQYRIDIRTARGVDVKVRMFFTRNSAGDRVRSETRATMKVRVARLW
jgi:hypothetical protein